MGIIDRIQEAAGFSIVTNDERKLVEALARDLSATTRELDLLGWTTLDYMSQQPAGSPADAPIATRRQWARHARRIWQTDPMAGAAVDLMNDFTWSRGVPAPRARDPKVQEVIDAAWADVDNKAALTTYDAQVALGTDLSLQSNLFFAVFDSGQDGKVKVSLLPHDRVVNVVRDEDNPMRILYYVVEQFSQKWDFDNDRPVMQGAVASAASGRGGVVDTSAPTVLPVKYYEHWQNPTALREEGIAFQECPEGKLAEGRVYHIATNRMSDMAFGVPTMQRMLRWLSGYNEVVAARVDMAKAAAAYIMKRQVKGTPGQVARLAQQSLSRRGEMGAASLAGTGTQVPPATGSILTENEAVQHEPFKLDSGASGAMQDTQMIRAQVSAAVGWPQHYLGDASASSLAGSTALELPVLKHVEARQELFENLFRAFIDRVIEKAVEDGKLDKSADPNDEAVIEAADAADEASTERDLSYEFSMPSPMRRMMIDLVSAVSEAARTFDPNNTNMELSRTLLAIVLGEAFEMQDPAEAVKRIFPEGYIDPAVAAAQEQAQAVDPAAGQPGGGDLGPGSEGAPTGGDGQDQSTNPYGAQLEGSTPEQQRQVKEAAEIEAGLMDDPAFREAWEAAKSVHAAILDNA